MSKTITHTFTNQRLTTVALPLLILCLAALLDLSARADFFTITLTNSTGLPSGSSFVVPSNTLARVEHVHAGSTCVQLAVTISNNISFYSFSQQIAQSQNLPVVIGPATISLTNADGCTTPLSYFTVQTVSLLTDTNSTSTNSTTQTNPAWQSIPSTAVVIPSDSNGPVIIVLESSVDMVNWVPALPGTYGTSSTNRFFRVRAQR